MSATNDKDNDSGTELLDDATLSELFGDMDVLYDPDIYNSNLEQDAQTQQCFLLPNPLLDLASLPLAIFFQQ